MSDGHGPGCFAPEGPNGKTDITRWATCEVGARIIAYCMRWLRVTAAGNVSGHLAGLTIIRHRPSWYTPHLIMVFLLDPIGFTPVAWLDHVGG